MQIIMWDNTTPVCVRVKAEQRAAVRAATVFRVIPTLPPRRSPPGFRASAIGARCNTHLQYILSNAETNSTDNINNTTLRIREQHAHSSPWTRTTLRVCRAQSGARTSLGERGFCEEGRRAQPEGVDGVNWMQILNECGQRWSASEL